MNKTELIKKVAEKACFTRGEATAAVNSVLESIEEELKKGSKVVLPGFGSFNVKYLAARKGSGFASHIKVIPPSLVVKFKAGSELQKIKNNQELKT